jgi:O-acetyl-ADP-ribose deacetylase (regulator of RNase III)
MIESVQGDLLRSKLMALVNPVNTVGVMGKGLALEFKNAYPENFKAYVKACKQDQVSVGKMFIFDCGLQSLPRYIINFPTKKHWRHPSKPEYISAGLQDLIVQIRILEIYSIAIPMLGAGLGGLDWAEVRSLILEAFVLLPDVHVLLFEPQSELDTMLEKTQLTVKQS